MARGLSDRMLNLRCRSCARGFSFTEILFAVIILGIGFIMIAAIFPVAIQQGKLTSEEGAATGIAREALNYLGQVGANSDSIANTQGGPLFPATGISNSITPYVGSIYSFIDPQPNQPPTSSPPSENTPNLYNWSLRSAQSPVNNTLLQPVSALSPTVPGNNLWNRLNLSLIVPSDQRYAFVGLYKRDGNPFDRRTWAQYAQVWFIPVTARNRSIYAAGTLSSPGADISSSNLQARLVKVSIDADPSGTYPSFSAGSYSTVHYVLYNWSGAAATSPYEPASLSENCFIIVAADQINTATSNVNGVTVTNVGRMNGHIYHVGLRRPDLDAVVGTSSVTAYDLSPNGDFNPDPGMDHFFGNNDDILTIGMQSKPSLSAPSSPFSGFSQYGNAAGPADAYVVGLDGSGTTPDLGSSQDISAFTTFIKVN